MSRSTLTIFVPLALSLSLGLAACQRGPATSKSEPAVGLRTELGRTLTKTQWCTENRVDADGELTFTGLEIQENARFVLTQFSLKDDGAVEEIGEERGSWALLGDDLIMKPKDAERTIKKVSTFSLKEASLAGKPSFNVTPGQETCVKLNDASFCPCFYQR